MAALALDADLAAALGTARAARWGLARDPYEPTVRRADADGGAPIAAVLTTRRPHTATVKIVDAWHAAAGRDALDGLVDAVLADSEARGDAAVKWEFAGEPPAGAEERGFVELGDPHPSADGTLGVRGLVRWNRPLPHAEAPYYGQTTLFTCGAVTGLLAVESLGLTGFGAGRDADRDLELAFWRQASNYPAVEPLGLAVALHETAPELVVEVALDHDGPVLLETFTGFDRDFRSELQAESAKQAAAAGIPVRRDRVAVDEIARRIAEGERAALLIDEAPMHGETGPHWVLAHAAHDGVVVIEDPWISADDGESWVDAHELPIALDDLDRMARWGERGYRGVVFLGRTVG